MIRINQITLESKFNPAPSVLKIGADFKDYNKMRDAIINAFVESCELKKVTRKSMANIFLNSTGKKIVTFYW